VNLQFTMAIIIIIYKKQVKIYFCFDWEFDVINSRDKSIVSMKSNLMTRREEIHGLNIWQTYKKNCILKTINDNINGGLYVEIVKNFLNWHIEKLMIKKMIVDNINGGFKNCRINWCIYWFNW